MTNPEEAKSLAGKVALVTGSTSGIGLGIARALAAARTHVVLNGFGDKAQIDKLVAEFRSQYRVKVDYSAADMSKPAEIAAMVAQAAREPGGVDILVNNERRSRRLVPVRLLLRRSARGHVRSRFTQQQLRRTNRETHT